MKSCAIPKIALTGPVQLELFVPYFRAAGFELAAVGEIPDDVYDVTEKATALALEIPGFFDDRLQKLAGCPYSIEGIKAIVDEYCWRRAAALHTAAFGPAKILAVDADNTLWRGIVSEDGIAALKHQREFQRGLRQLHDDGVVLVLLTKNDESLIQELFAGEKELAEIFTICAINWRPKPGNLIEICKKLNLSPESAVFVDDNPHERALMAAHLPGVAVAPWSGWRQVEDSARSAAEQGQLIRRLREYFFAQAGLTEEDRLRGADYARKLALAALEASAERPTLNEYLDSLELAAEYRAANVGDLDRLAQMAAKTNQFNATTRRRTRDEFAALLAAEAAGEPVAVRLCRARDRFGEQGTVCYLIIDLAAGRITDFVMSCRAMGRTLEHFALNQVRAEFGRNFAIDFVATAKNHPFAEFLASVTDSPLPTYYH